MLDQYMWSEKIVCGHPEAPRTKTMPCGPCRRPITLHLIRLWLIVSAFTCAASVRVDGCSWS